MARLVSPTDRIPRSNIVMLVVGTRGDVQPFLAYGKELQSAGHRVRLATHKVFQKLVLNNELEFFPLAGNPDELMEYMVRNGGIFPSISAFLTGQVWKNERTVGDILKTTWHACVCDDQQKGRPFVADVIIANPPSFGHIHCAEKLGIPLHMVFTMPWSKTVTMPHPFTWSHRMHNRNDQRNIRTYAYIDGFVSNNLYVQYSVTFYFFQHFHLTSVKLIML
jgi:UDP:flavonoid glycosyltransferase YjiC (YdhE family)